MKILLTRLDHLGDLILTTPLIRALAKAGHTVDVLTLKSLLPVLEENPFVHDTYGIEHVVPGFPKDWRRLRTWMQVRGYEGMLLPNPKPRQLLCCSFGSGARVRIALQAGIWGRLTLHQCLTVSASFRKGRHYSDLQLDLARAMQVPADGLKPDYFCRAEEKRWAREKIAEMFPDVTEGPIVGIHPGCLGNTCNLPSRTYADFAELILERTPARIIVTGTASEKKLFESWPKKLQESSRVWNSCGQLDLRRLAAVIARMDHYVIGSTGPLHLASALGVRTVSPFCAIPPLTSSVWGNITGTGTTVQPAASSCRAWTAQAKPHQHCDFRGEVCAEHLWQSLAGKKSIQL